MGTYKVLQDIEGEDKLIAWLTPKQTIYAAIVVVSAGLGFVLGRVNILLAVPVTLVMAVLSWKLVETRAISGVNPLTDWIARFFRLPSNAAGQSL